MIGTLRKLVLLNVLLFSALTLGAQSIPQRIVFKQLQVGDLLPVNEVNCMFQDQKGFIWLGTRNGLYRYDGYRVKQYRNTPDQPHILVSNDVHTLNQDGEGRLWVGTQKGISILDLQTGQDKSLHFSDFYNSDIINHILFTRSGDLWIGSEGGLYGQCVGRDSSLTLYCDKRKKAKIPHSSVTALIEDSKGYVWIGTWDKGLFRYNPRDGQFYEIPRNELNSTQALFEDSKGRLWVGTRGKGLYCISNPHDSGPQLSFRHYGEDARDYPLSSNIIWDIDEDPNNGLVWVGTKKGLSFVPLQNKEYTILPRVDKPQPDYFSRGVNAIFRDHYGRMWLYANERGIVSANTRPSHFDIRQLPGKQKASDQISSICYDNNGRLLVATSMAGILGASSKKGDNDDTTSNVNCILAVSDSVLFGTLKDGLIIQHKGKVIRQCRRGNSLWMADNCVYCLYRDAQDRILIGTWKGLSILNSNGTGTHLEGSAIRPLESAQVASITCDNDYSLWIGTKDSGIIHLIGDIGQPESLRMKQYTTLAGGDYQALNIYRVMADKRGHLWACSQEAGLLLYDPGLDAFRHVGTEYGIPDDDIYSIEESNYGRLWLSARHHLISLTFKQDSNTPEVSCYDRRDIIGEDYFGAGLSAVSPKGQITFAGQYTYVSFHNKNIPEPTVSQRPFITDVKQQGVPVTPMPVGEVTLKPSQRDLTIEFSSLNFDNIDGTRYSYMLDRLESQWHSTNPGTAHVSYSQLPYGTYTFRLRCTGEGGRWSSEEQTLVINVPKPFWKRWYAWLCYILALLAVINFVIRRRSERERCQPVIHHPEMHRPEIQPVPTERPVVQEQHEDLRPTPDDDVSDDNAADADDTEPTTSDEDFVRQCTICVQQYIADCDFGLPQFADAMNMSKSTLYKKLNAATGLSTSGFIRTVRMKYACQLIQQNPLARITDVATAVGYADPKYFSTSFKKDLGMLPTEYAASLKKS